MHSQSTKISCRTKYSGEKRPIFLQLFSIRFSHFEICKFHLLTIFSIYKHEIFTKDSEVDKVDIDQKEGFFHETLSDVYRWELDYK